MSRSGYIDDVEDQWALICWRGAVASAIRGRRGQAFLKEMIMSLDALPKKELIAHELEQDGEVCAIGAVGLRRGINMEGIDPDDPDTVAAKFGISVALARETVYMNDEYKSTPQTRFQAMWCWAAQNLRSETLNMENLPKYKSHKVVGALKISGIELHKDGSATIAPAGEEHPPFRTDDKWRAKYHGNDFNPENPDLGYFVQYEDGYTSWSPTKAFEEGYNRIEETPDADQSGS